LQLHTHLHLQHTQAQRSQHSQQASTHYLADCNAVVHLQVAEHIQGCATAVHTSVLLS
jgi:hypothetical protein